jgi:hypothetical protein
LAQIFYLAFAGVAGTFALLGALQIGPLTKYIYKTSVSLRGEYWQAGWNMGSEHPLTGVGFDTYGDWYRRLRDTQALILPGPNTTTNAAHNVPFDVFAFGGWPLFISYIGILILSVIAIIKVTARNRKYDATFVTLTTAWTCYQVQSLISINQLGLGVWGWSLTGLLIGYELNTRDKPNDGPIKPSGKVSKKKEQIPASVLLIAVAAAAIGSAASLPPYLAANKYYKALQSGDGNILYESAYLKPYDRTRFLYTAQIMQENKLEDRAIQILSDGSKLYPDSFEIWQRWAGIPSATPAQIAKAKAEMKRLDPLNPEWK